MKKELIGLNTYLYSFPLREEKKYNAAMKRLKKTGKVTVVFLNNRYGFEYKKSRRG